jgi:hypothetical protein
MPDLIQVVSISVEGFLLRGSIDIESPLALLAGHQLS